MALEAVMDARAWRDGIYASTAVPGGMYAASARCDEWPSEYPRVAERRAHRQRVFSDEVNRHMPISRMLFVEGRGADLLVITPRNWPSAVDIIFHRDGRSGLWRVARPETEAFHRQPSQPRRTRVSGNPRRPIKLSSLDADGHRPTDTDCRLTALTPTDQAGWRPRSAPTTHTPQLCT